jgi:hypothetical protein
MKDISMQFQHTNQHVNSISSTPPPPSFDLGNVKLKEISEFLKKLASLVLDIHSILLFPSFPKLEC